MPIAYWCILIAAVLPFVWVGVAKSGPVSRSAGILAPQPQQTVLPECLELGA